MFEASKAARAIASLKIVCSDVMTGMSQINNGMLEEAVSSTFSVLDERAGAHSSVTALRNFNLLGMFMFTEDRIKNLDIV